MTALGSLMLAAVGGFLGSGLTLAWPFPKVGLSCLGIAMALSAVFVAAFGWPT